MIETSPRLGGEYRSYMQRWFSYRTSDFDLSAHRGDIQLDLQAIDLPDASVDVVLTPHVLEHVPDTDRALAELFRVIAPGGRMYLQVPLLHGVTAAPTTPEFHADNTPVFWNFGWDLTDRLRAAGFTSTVLVTNEFAQVLRGDLDRPDAHGDIFQIDSLVDHARIGDLTTVADDEGSPPHGTSNRASSSRRGSACARTGVQAIRMRRQRPSTRRRMHILIMSRPSQNALSLSPVTELSPTRG